MFIENLWRRRQWRQYDITEIHIKINDDIFIYTYIIAKYKNI